MRFTYQNDYKTMLNFIDSFLNKTTMYRLVLYYLIGLVCAALLLSLFHLVSFTPLALLVSTAILLITCWIVNTIFAKIFHAQTNIESVYISALILVLILTPIATFRDIPFLIWVSIWTMASKYLLTINRKHIFNPVAFGVWITALGLSHYARWWIGTGVMLPFLLIGGLLVVRKIQREDLVFSFFIAALLTIAGFSFFGGGNSLVTFKKVILETPLFFLAFVMLTEPLTTPPTKILQMYYGVLVGILFAPQISFFGIRTTPESALLIGNIFSYMVSPKVKLFLHLKEKIPLAPDIFDFVFMPEKRVSFAPGQYMEWTLTHRTSDSRGNRRYFTLASSPTEEDVRIGVRFYPQSSSFKKALSVLQSNDEVIASQIAGNFVLPKDQKKKLVFIAGGIGITPYRSMIKYLLDKNEKRPIILLYTAKTPAEFTYTDIFEKAKTLGIKTVYAATDTTRIPKDWQGHAGRIDAPLIQQEVPDYKERTFYLSGPQTMVNGFEKTLQEMGIPGNQIKKDFFPGFA